MSGCNPFMPMVFGFNENAVTIFDVWYGRSVSATIVRWLLYPLSLVYAGAWRAYLLVYQLGLKKAKKPHSKILCIGNLVAGGTGKTPTVRFVAQCLLDQGKTVVIGCSGYGSPRSEHATLAPDGPLDPKIWGDEPAELRLMLPDIPIIVGRARVTAAEICAEHFPESVLLMDDGFQHMPLAKDRTIVIEPDSPNRLTFPAGPYREPRKSGLQRADLVVGTGKYSLQFSPLTLRNSHGDPENLSTPANVLTAIGRPDRFREALEAVGITIAKFDSRSDHDPLNLEPDDFASDYPWVATQKDWVKIRQIEGIEKVPILVATRTATIAPEAHFREWLKIEIA